MLVAEFVRQAKQIAEKYKTRYAWGTFGSPFTENLLIQKQKQYPDWYTPRMVSYRALIGKGYFAFDCVGLIKGILWGWTGAPNHGNGGAQYLANGISDIDANVMKNRCLSVSTSFTGLLSGEILWKQGHIGIYIGDGLAVECTPSWKDGVQITAVGNMGNKAGYPTQTWSCHGKLPWVEYSGQHPVGEIGIGDLVSITGDSYATGGKIPVWAKQKPHKVSQLKGEQVLLGWPDGISSWVMTKDVRKI